MKKHSSSSTTRSQSFVPPNKGQWLYPPDEIGSAATISIKRKSRVEENKRQFEKTYKYLTVKNISELRFNKSSITELKRKFTKQSKIGID